MTIFVTRGTDFIGANFVINWPEETVDTVKRKTAQWFLGHPVWATQIANGEYLN